MTRLLSHSNFGLLSITSLGLLLAAGACSSDKGGSTPPGTAGTGAIARGPSRAAGSPAGTAGSPPVATAGSGPGVTGGSGNTAGSPPVGTAGSGTSGGAPPVGTGGSGPGT